jgi:hypothetical protein
MDEVMEDAPFIYYDGGDGSSLEDAIVIHGADTEPEAVAAEYRYVERIYGPGCMRDRQSLGQHDGRWYDILEIVLPGGSRTAIYFDITEQFLHGLRERLQDAFVGNESVLTALDAPLKRALDDLDRPSEGDVPMVVKAAGFTAAAIVVGMGVQMLFAKKKHRRVAA